MTTRRRRIWTAGAIAVLAFGLGGCVFLRLLQLKRQLADFDRYFSLHTDTGVRLVCVEPVLRADDVKWLGFAPATTNLSGNEELWNLRWRKQRAAGSDEVGDFHITFDLAFTEGRLSGLWIPESYFSALPKSVVVNGIKSLGRANVDKSERSVESQVGLALNKESWPTRKTIASVLGEPTEVLSAENPTWRYHFLSNDPAREGKDIELHFVFDATTDKLLSTHGRLPVGRMKLNFAEGAE